MFLSRIEVAWGNVRNPYEFHRQLWRLFPREVQETRQTPEGGRQGFLFRVEEHKPGRLVRFLVQSRYPPTATSGLALLGTREFQPRPATDMRLAFLLTANPIKTVTDAERDSKPGKKSEKCRVPLIREEDQKAWLARKLADIAEIEVATALPHPPLYFHKGNRGGKLALVTFEGVLRVREPATFANCLENGIGPAKAFGCGLLLVRRI